MSLHDYNCAGALASSDDSTFYGHVMAAMMRADTDNLAKLKAAWPEVWDELQHRYNAPQGLMPGETNHETGDSYESLMKIRERAGLA